ncbi:MAG: tetraacyldisaccharide 4'-kinase [Bacteroidales bacterium]|nr:tetraacyldisaccharide 4'-kinase [Bacteroidales bacterium]
MESKHSGIKFLFLYPFYWLYSTGVFIRNRLYDYGIYPSYSFDIPIISIGNITVGGTGKTPHVEHFVSELNKDIHVAVLSRGYKRKTKGYRLVSETDTYQEVGDEPLQIKKKFPKTTVCVDSNRKRAIERLSKSVSPVPDLILMDDGFQHRRVKPTFSVLLIDFHRQLHEDHLLPIGLLREHAHETRRASTIIITNTPEIITPIDRRLIIKNLNLFPYQQLFFTSVQYLEPRELISHEIYTSKLFNSETEDKHILLVTGIANPFQYKSYLASELTKNIISYDFPDHHAYTLKDLQKIRAQFESIPGTNKILITTEKDAVRLINHANLSILEDLPAFYIPISIKFVDQERKLTRQILDYVRKNQRNSQLYK